MLTWLAELQERKWLLILALIAVLVRLPWVAAMSDRTPRFDELEYATLAENLCAGSGYVDSKGLEGSFWPVGYPAVLAAGFCTFGARAEVAVDLQVFFLVLTCLALSIVGERSLGRRIGRTGALLLAFYPNYIFYSTLLLTEPLCTLLLVSMTGLLLRIGVDSGRMTWLAVGVGVLAGLTALVRPSFMLLPVLLPLWGLVQGMRWARIARLTLIATVVSLATVSPWMIRNHEITGSAFEIASSGGLVFWIGNHPEAVGGVAHAAGVGRALGAWTQAYDSALGYRLGVESIMADVPGAIRRSLQKVTYLFAIETDGAMWNFQGLGGGSRGMPAALVASLAWIAAVASGVFAMVHGLRNRALGCWFLLLVGYSIVITMAFVGDPRYHFPLVPFLLLYSAAAIVEEVPARLKAFRDGGLRVQLDRKLLAWLAAMAAFSLLIVANLWLKTLE